MTQEFDYQTSDEQAEEAAWALAEQAAGAEGSEQQARVAEIRATASGMDDAQLREGTLASIAQYLAPGVPDEALIQLLDGIDSHAVAAQTAATLAAQRFRAGRSLQRLQDYADTRAGQVASRLAAVETGLALARQRLATDQAVAGVLTRAEERLGEPGTEVAGIERALELATVWAQAGETARARARLDELVGSSLGPLEPGPARQSLLLRALDLYLVLGAADAALALLDKLEPEAADLSARRAAQKALEGPGDFAIADRFIAVIERPHERFLALESRLAKAWEISDGAQQEATAEAIAKLVPQLEPGQEQAEAALVLARHAGEGARERVATQWLERARAQAQAAEPPQRAILIRRIDGLEAALGLR